MRSGGAPRIRNISFPEGVSAVSICAGFIFSRADPRQLFNRRTGSATFMRCLAIQFRGSSRETEIQVQLEFGGMFSRIAGFAVEAAIERRTRHF